MQQTKLDKRIIQINRIRDLYWKESYTAGEIAKKLKLSSWSIYEFMRRHNIPRRSYSDANYVFYSDKPQFKLKEKLNSSEEQLKIAGIMLYWAEGTLIGSTVDFTNSNPRMIKVFLRFLREVCGISNNRLRIYLYAYTYQDLKKLRSYWSSLTGVPLSQFTKPYIRAGNPNACGRKLLYGLVHVRYNDTKLLENIKAWINEYISKICGEVP
jgi:hypothetical protein